MTPNDVMKIYNANVKNTEIFMNNISHNKDGVLLNAAVTSCYLELARNDPPFLWLALGSLVSNTVGKNIHFSSLVNQYTLGVSNAASTILKDFAGGNQLIFKSIVPLYKTFQQVGLEGIKLLKGYKDKTPFNNDAVIKAFEDYDNLRENQKKIAQSLNLSNNHPKVIDTLLSEPHNEKLANDAAYNIALHEQNQVQEMYENFELISIMMNPLLGFIGHQFHLDGIEIDGIKYNMMDYVNNPADIDQRMVFVKILTSALMQCVKSKGIESVFSAIQDKANEMYWLANIYTAPDKIGGPNGYYWANKAEYFDEELSLKIIDFIELDPSISYFAGLDIGAEQALIGVVLESVAVKEDAAHLLESEPSNISSVAAVLAKEAAQSEKTPSLLLEEDAMLEMASLEHVQEKVVENNLEIESTVEKEEPLPSFLVELMEDLDSIELSQISATHDLPTIQDFIEFDDSVLFADNNEEHNNPIEFDTFITAIENDVSIHHQFLPNGISESITPNAFELNYDI